MIDLEIDGGVGSGGGQILRTATALSAITGKSFRIYNIRKKKSNPGLRPQHLNGLKAVAKLCDAKLKNADLNSTKVEFYPSELEPKELNVNIRTAGAIGLLFQSLQLPSSQTNEKVTIKVRGGSTISKWSPPIMYVKNILLPILDKTRYRAEVKVIKHGFYPVGGARVDFTVHPWKPQPLTLIRRGKLREIKGISLASIHLRKPKVAERQAKEAEKLLEDYFGFNPNISYEYVQADCPGSGIVVWIETGNSRLAYDVIGERGLASEKVGEMASNGLIKQWETEAPLDKFMADQILVFLSLAKEKSKIRVAELTDHCLTNVWVIEKFLPVKFEVKGEKGNPGMIEIIPKLT